MESSQELIELIAGFGDNPLGYVRGAFPWKSGELLNSTGPREWQGGVLSRIGEHLRSSRRYEPLKIAVASGHGVGKSALIAWVTAWALDTCDDAKVLITAGTGQQLETKTRPEVAKWFRSKVTAHWWDVRATSIRSLSAGHEATWRADYVTWSEDNVEAFAGLHNQGKRIVVVYDEASAIADKVWDTTEGALTDAGTEIIWLAFGNPTQNSGRFRECFGSAKHRWTNVQIDSRSVDGTNKAQIEKWIEDYGEDSDFVRVRVRGEFPRAASSQFMPSDVVAACRRYKAVGCERMPKVMAVDVARYGDDQTVIGMRQGRRLSVLAKHRGLDNMQVASHVANWIEKEAPDAIVVDGDGLGAGVVDRLKQLGHGRRLTEFHGGASADDSAQYFNRRVEVWGLLREALRSGAELPNDPELDQELTGPQYGFSPKMQIQLEKKEDMKKRGIGSPDIADMLAMTFAVNVAQQRRVRERRQFVSPGYQSGSWMA